MNGVLHIHSVFSDGEESLERLVDLLKSNAMSFAAVSDHAEVFDEKRMEEYVDLCRRLSSPDFLVIPGLEFALHGGDIHILGYGITRRIRFKSMEELVDGIHGAGGIAVLAHPPAGSTNWIGPIKAKLDGIEVWNIRYDGPHSPRAKSFQLLRSIRSVNLKAAAYCGVDLHKAQQLRRPVYVEIAECRLERDGIMNALRSGEFRIKGGNISIPSTGDLTFVQELAIAVKQPLCRPWTG